MAKNNKSSKASKLINNKIKNKARNNALRIRIEIEPTCKADIKAKNCKLRIRLNSKRRPRVRPK